MTRATHRNLSPAANRAWALVFAACLLCAALCCVARAESGDLDARIAKQEQRADTAWYAALDARDTFWHAQQNWAQDWPHMHNQAAYYRCVQKQWRVYDKRMRAWQREAGKLVTLYDARRMQRASP